MSTCIDFVAGCIQHIRVGSIGRPFAFPWLNSGPKKVESACVCMAGPREQTNMTAPKMLILMAGMPGSGKSTVARELGHHLGFPVIDKDVILSALLATGVPETIAQSAAYNMMLDLGESLLQQGMSVVLDSPASLPETVSVAKGVCRGASAKLVVVLCSSEQGVRNERVASRTSLPSQPASISTTPGTARERFLHLPDVVQDAVAAAHAVVDPWAIFENR